MSLPALTDSEYVTADRIATATDKTVRSIQLTAARQRWPFRESATRGGRVREYPISALPPQYQSLIVRNGEVSFEMVPALAPEAALIASDRLLSFADTHESGRNRADWNEPISLSVLRDERVRRILTIVREALAIPAGWKKRAWIEAVAAKYDVSFQTVYKYIRKYEKRGISAFDRRKSTRGELRVWDRAALDYWNGLCLKREHRKMSLEALYDHLAVEADRKGWRIGSYRSALDYHAKIAPQQTALQKGGARALDNTLPPILRTYADLRPFQILVGDQHRFDFWVMDDDTGEVFRPEGYVWQDLRTRIFYGGAVGKKYDSLMMGLALRIGLRVYGAFESIYTDNGQPELSKHVDSIVADMRTIGLAARPIDSVDGDCGEDGEAVNPCVDLGRHRKAIVKNAKAKMIERTFEELERILRDRERMPGHVKRLTDGDDDQDIDEAEKKRLAASGKILTFSEFVKAFYRAMDFYNRKKAHRGVLKEWEWRPKPSIATPYDCLKACCIAGWRRTDVSAEATDLIFLSRAKRTVDRGRIWLNKQPFEHKALIELHGQKVDLRYDPLDPEYVVVFKGDEYVCKAEPVELSSMLKPDLSSRLIKEKRRMLKEQRLEYRRLTSPVPDLLNYSRVSPLDKAAALMKRDATLKKQEQLEMFGERTPEALAKEVKAAAEVHEAKPVLPPRAAPPRPSYFLQPVDRYKWVVLAEEAGEALREDDAAFKSEFESAMDADQREYWETVRRVGVV